MLACKDFYRLVSISIPRRICVLDFVTSPFLFPPEVTLRKATRLKITGIYRDHSLARSPLLAPADLKTAIQKTYYSGHSADIEYMSVSKLELSRMSYVYLSFVNHKIVLCGKELKYFGGCAMYVRPTSALCAIELHNCITKHHAAFCSRRRQYVL